jgi:hypothetical protein
VSVPVPTTVTPCASRYPKPYKRPLTDPGPLQDARRRTRLNRK